MTKWIRLKDKNPPKDVTLWGYCVNYDEVHLCSWNGDFSRDDRLPSISSLTANGDDYSIEYWMITEVPNAPNCEVGE